jgi:hypothetical protein
MSCDNSTYYAAIVDHAPCSNFALDVDYHAAPTEAKLEGNKSLKQGRPRLTADPSKSNRYRHEVRSRIAPDSTQTDPECVWGDEGPIND